MELDHPSALRALGNRLVGILHGRLRHRPPAFTPWPGRIAAAMLDPARLAEAFALGQPQGPLVLVPGAWSNRLWRLKTEQGRFAIKELRRLPAAGGWSDYLQVAMTVERAAWRAGTIPMAEPMTAVGSGGWLAEVATTTGRRATVRCHRWVSGTPATRVAPSPAMAADVGRSLAALHASGWPLR